MKRFSKKFGRKLKRLTAAQARAIPIEEAIVENALQEIYRGIREVASHGESEILWRHNSFSDGIKEIVRQRLEDDGYYIDDTTSIFSWKIIWRELR